MFDLAAVQAALKEQQLDGWLLYDFRGLNILARRVLGFGANAMLSRRWFYYVPAKGEPRKLMHKIEPHALDHLPGYGQLYLRWQELESGVQSLVSGVRRVINVGLLADDLPQPGEWVLIHVGFALSKIDEAEAAAAMQFLEGIGQAYEDELAALAESRIE